MNIQFVSALAASLIFAACGKTPEPTVAPSVAPVPAPPAAAAAPAAVAPPPATAQAPAPATAVAAVAAVAAKTPVWTAIPAPAALGKAALTGAAGKTTVNFRGLEADIPANWQSTPPENSMRLAQYLAPVPGKAPAEIVVFYFPPGNGGNQEDNINRWTSQFSDGKGGVVKPTLHRTTINGMPITRAELNGHYARGVGVGAEGTAQPNQTLIAAIITTPVQGNVTLHIFGPKDIVNQHRKAFDEILASIRFKG